MVLRQMQGEKLAAKLVKRGGLQAHAAPGICLACEGEHRLPAGLAGRHAHSLKPHALYALQCRAGSRAERQRRASPKRRSKVPHAVEQNALSKLAQHLRPKVLPAAQGVRKPHKRGARLLGRLCQTRRLAFQVPQRLESPHRVAPHRFEKRRGPHQRRCERHGPRQKEEHAFAPLGTPCTLLQTRGDPTDFNVDWPQRRDFRDIPTTGKRLEPVPVAKSPYPTPERLRLQHVIRWEPDEGAAFASRQLGSVLALAWAYNVPKAALVRANPYGGTFMQHVAAHIAQLERRLVAPIWGGRKDFDFLCVGYLDVAQAMGLRVDQVTPLLRQVVPGQVADDTALDALIARGAPDPALLEGELRGLQAMRAWRRNPACQVVPGYEGWCGGGCFGPLTVANAVLGVEALLRDTRRNPAFLHRLLDHVTTLLEGIASAEAQASADFFWIAEPVASLLSPSRYWEFCGQYLQRVFAAAHGVAGFLHVCGKTTHQTIDMVRTGAEVLSVDSMTDMAECLRIVGPEVVMMGNVDPALLRCGTLDEARHAVRALNDVVRGHPNFIMSTGCSVQEGTPQENVEALIEETLSYPL